VRFTVQGMDDIGVMQRGRRGAVGQREGVAEPAVMVASVELAIQDGLGELESGVGVGDAVRVCGVGGRSAAPTILAPAWRHRSR
jgi:hypothetical protein